MHNQHPCCEFVVLFQSIRWQGSMDLYCGALFQNHNENARSFLLLMESNYDWMRQQCKYWRKWRYWPSWVSISSTWFTLESCCCLSGAGVWFMLAGRATGDSRPKLFDISWTNHSYLQLQLRTLHSHNPTRPNYTRQPTFNARGSVPLDLLKSRWTNFNEPFSSTRQPCEPGLLFLLEDKMLIFEECLLAARPMTANFNTRIRWKIGTLIAHS